MKITKREIVSDLKLNESVLIDIDFDNLDSDLEQLSTDVKTLSADVKTLSTDVSSNVKLLSDDIDGLKDTIENLTFNGCSCDLEQLSTDILDEATKEIKDDISKNKISGDSQQEDTLSKSVALSSIDGKNCYTLYNFNGGCANAYLTQEAPYEYLGCDAFAITYFDENGDMPYDYAYNGQLLIRLNKNDSGDCELKYLDLASLTAILTNSIELTDIYDQLDYLSNEITAISSNTNIEEDITNIQGQISYLSNEITAISSNTNIEEDITNIQGQIDQLTDEITAITDIYDQIDYLSDELSVISSSNTDIQGQIEHMWSDIYNAIDDLSDVWIKGGTYEENYGASIGDEFGCEAINLNDRVLIGVWSLAGGTMEFHNYDMNNGYTQINGGEVYADLFGGQHIVSYDTIRIGCTSINEEQLQKLLALLN